MNTPEHEIVDIRYIFRMIIGLQEILGRSMDSLRKLTNLSSNSQDVRLITLSATREILVQFGWAMGAILIATDDDNLDRLKSLVDNNAADKLLAQTKMNDYLRRTLIIAIHFNIDNMFKALLTEMDEIQGAQGFRHFAGKLREMTGSTNRDFDTLMALTYMRNCFHNNGIHKDKELRIDLGGYQIDFIPNQSVSYSIKDVFAVLNASIPIVCEWLMKNPLAKLTNEIQDPGALAASPMEES